MRVAVLTLTRDRLEYTKHCFASLAENAGCDYDHYVWDNGSTDGTAEWLDEQPDLDVTLCEGNLGICPALNHLLGYMKDEQYDVIVRFDNDCEVTHPDTLRIVCELAYDHDAILSPTILGLQSPPVTVATTILSGRYVSEKLILGGIFMAIPAHIFGRPFQGDHFFRYDEDNPPYTGDEAIVPYWRAQGGIAGYIDGISVNHYETTVGQQATYPEYHARKLAEMAA